MNEATDSRKPDSRLWTGQEKQNGTTGVCALDGMVVTELGGREGVAICGSLLAQLGATVIIVEPAGRVTMRDGCRAQFAAGKLSLSFNRDSELDRALLGKLLASSDVVLTSSDIDPADFQVHNLQPENIVCDLTAFGSSGPRTGEALSEMQLQALSGIMHTTGMSDGPPVPISVPVIGYATGAYAAAAVLAALRVRRWQGFGQRVEVAMFDSAFVSLNAFLAGVLTGQVSDRTRVGNRHPTVAPWNLYATADGWILICAGNQGQWERLCAEMGRPDVAEKFNTQPSRILGIEEVDKAVEQWTRTLSTAECVDRLATVGVASGPIAHIDQYPREANLAFRGMIRTLHDPVSGSALFVPGSPLTLRGSPPVQPTSIPAPDADRAEVERIANKLVPPSPATAPQEKLARPLSGIRVVEIGQYTTAPLCARHLAHLGAEVIKIEKPGGDEQRAWVPHFGGRSETYCMNNADKRDMVLDLHSPTGRDVLTSLLRTADVLVENNKPGTLAKFGFSAAALAEINPKLVYCAISAFGANSLYADRPGFDTVIQAASGFMTALRPDGMPLKSGISTADLMGAEMGIVAILGALEHRDRTGCGQHIDLSMQDISCWLTSAVWNTELTAIPRPAVVRCADGFVLAETSEAGLAKILKDSALALDALATRTRTEVAGLLTGLGLSTAQVNSIKEASEMPQTKTRGIWYTMPQGGLDWPLLSSPLRLHLTPPEILRLAPDLNQDGEVILQELDCAAERVVNGRCQRLQTLTSMRRCSLK